MASRRAVTSDEVALERETLEGVASKGVALKVAASEGMALEGATSKGAIASRRVALKGATTSEGVASKLAVASTSASSPQHPWHHNPNTRNQDINVHLRKHFLGHPSAIFEPNVIG